MTARWRDVGEPAARRGASLPDVRALAGLCEAELSRLHERGDPAPWAAAAEMWAGLHRPYRAAYSRWRLAETQLAAKAPKAAAVALHQAWRVAADLGADPLRRELELLAQRGRIDLDDVPTARGETRTPTPADRLGLTSREREVLGHLLEGRTNRQIARALFITEKTASVHVPEASLRRRILSRLLHV